MSDLLYALAMVAALSSGGAVALWGINRCCSHEVEMLQRRARDRQSESLGGGDDRLAVHADGDTYVAR